MMVKDASLISLGMLTYITSFFDVLESSLEIVVLVFTAALLLLRILQSLRHLKKRKG